MLLYAIVIVTAAVAARDVTYTGCIVQHEIIAKSYEASLYPSLLYIFVLLQPLK